MVTGEEESMKITDELRDQVPPASENTITLALREDWKSHVHQGNRYGSHDHQQGRQRPKKKKYATMFI